MSCVRSVCSFTLSPRRGCLFTPSPKSRKKAACEVPFEQKNKIWGSPLSPVITPVRSKLVNKVRLEQFSAKSCAISHVSPGSSPRLRENSHTPDLDLRQVQQDLQLIPNASILSPSVFEHLSPDVDSPTCRHSSPPNGFLYTPDRKNTFLGRGTFGSVTLCRYKSHKFALKIVRRSVSVTIGEKNLLQIHHAHLVRILRISEILDRVFISMEFAGHCNLQELLDNKDVDIRRRASFAQQVACGLCHCHQQRIVHGDVKPANVIVNPVGHCKLGDFGFSFKVDNPPKFHDGCLKGTAAYAAPEVLQGKNYSPASDVYSFGIMLWQIYTREIPYGKEHPHVIIYKVVKKMQRPAFKHLRNEFDDGYFMLTISCWKQDPEMRPSSQFVFTALKKLSAVLSSKKCNDCKLKIHGMKNIRH